MWSVCSRNDGRVQGRDGIASGIDSALFLVYISDGQVDVEIRQESPWTIMFTDDLLICREQVEAKLDTRRYAFEGRGIKVGRDKTEYICMNERLYGCKGVEVMKADQFKYLMSSVQGN